MKILFMGTPDFAAGILQALIDGGHEILLAVTQPDRPKGRSGEPAPSPVKLCALAHNIPVFQPRRIKTPEAVEELSRIHPQVCVVAAFGQILSQEILDLPDYGCLNVHASLLPKYRGASPIQHAILAGEQKTGVTIMQMDAGLDTGDMLLRREIPIERTDDSQSLHEKLTALGEKAILEALSLLEQGKLIPEKQPEESCYAPLIEKSMGRIDFSKSAEEIDRQIRAMTPWPSAYTEYRGRQLKIWKAQPLEGKTGVCGVPGEILEAGKDGVTVAAGDGALRILELQLEGKKRMAVRDFLSGVRLQPGERLGKESV